MRFLLTYLRFHKDKVTVVGLIGLIVVGIVLAVVLRPSAGGGVTLLGDVNAGVPVEPQAAPSYANGPPAQVRPGMSDLVVSERSRAEAAAALAPDTRYVELVLDGLNCVRAQAQQAALPLDPQLSEEAAALGRTLAANPTAPMDGLPVDPYALVVVLPLTLADLGVAMPDPAAAASDAAGAIVAPAAIVDPAAAASPALESPCALGSVNLMQLDVSPATEAVGIAVFPDTTLEDGWDMTTAVILTR